MLKRRIAGARGARRAVPPYGIDRWIGHRSVHRPSHGGLPPPGLLAARPCHGTARGLAWCAAGRPGCVAVDGCLDAPAAALRRRR
jgi:hypothetical protein